MIGIIGAMEQEIAQLKDKMVITSSLTKASMNFYSGQLGDKEVVIVRSGIGKVNAGICTQILADKFDVSCIINTGIAGSLEFQINIGDIVLSTDCIQHDVDVTALGYLPGIIPDMDTSAFAADSKLAAKAEEVCKRVNPDIRVFTGRILSGDQFVANKDRKEQLIQQFHGMCTEMEGAAIAQTSFLNQIPFLIVRAISDKADNSAEMDYPEFEAKAITHTVQLMTALIAEL